MRAPVPLIRTHSRRSELTRHFSKALNKASRLTPP